MSRKVLLFSYDSDISRDLIIEDIETREIKSFSVTESISSIVNNYFKEEPNQSKESFYNGYILFTKTFDNIHFQKNNIYKVVDGFFETFPNINSKPFKTFNDIGNFFDKDYWNIVEINGNLPFYNGKILFLEESEDNSIKKNKIYEIKNGIFIDEKDRIVPYASYSHPFTSFNDIQSYFSNKGRCWLPYHPKADVKNYKIIEIQK